MLNDLSEMVSAFSPADAAQAGAAVQNAAPEEADAHRGMLGTILGMLSGQGVDVNQLAQSYGLPHADVNNMSPEQLGQLTLQLAREHPQIVQDVAQQFPAAQGILGTILGSGGAANGGAGGGGFLGGLLNRVLL